MEASAARGEAVLDAVEFSSEHLLRGAGDTASRLQEVMAHLGAAAGADRAYLFQNLRDPQGRLWMDLRAEWDALGIRRIFDDPDAHLHPYAPTFTRRIDAYWRGDVLAEVVASMPEDERAVLESEDVRSILSVPVFVHDGRWGTSGSTIARWSASGATWRSMRSGRSRTRSERCSIGSWRSAHKRAGGRSVPFDDRARSCGQLHRRDRRQRVDDLHQPAGRGAPRVFTTGVDRGPGALAEPVAPDDRSRALAENERHNETGEPFRMEVWVHDEATVVRDERGVPRFSHGVMMDVSDRKRGEENVAFLAYHDELTGLPSRSMFDELLELSLSRARRHDGAVAVIAVDIDDFRLVNDSLGHVNGDEILRMVADRLREASRETRGSARCRSIC